ncbi:MAG: hypothetical protein R3256_12080, partial [Thalassovita sp.]|nr:hypothetical protein [Thalassovita sp.]
RAETLPSEERQGLTQSSTVFRTFFVFRRPRAGDSGKLFAPGEIGSPAPVADDEPDSQRAQDPSEMEESDAKETAIDPR